MSVRARSWRWRRLLPIAMLLALGLQFGPPGTPVVGANEWVDLELRKSDQADPVKVGQTIPYRIEFSNRGPEPASGISVVDRLPQGVDFVSANASHGGDCEYSSSSHSVSCDGFGSLFWWYSDRRIQIQVKATAEAEGEIWNEAEIFTEDRDQNGGNNLDRERTTVLGPESANVTIEKSAPGEVFREDQFVYGLTVSNAGPDTARNIVVTDALPAEVSFRPTSGCSAGGAPQVVTCGLGNLANGGETTKSINVRADALGTDVVNSASVSWETADNSGTATSDPVSTDIVPSADVSIVKSATETAKVGDTLTYYLGVSNAGPDPAGSVEVIDVLPAGVNFEEASDGCSYAEDVRKVTCDAAVELAKDGILSYSIEVTAAIAGSIENTATVSTSTEDRNLANNSSSDSTMVQVRSADLRVTKSGPAENPKNGEEFDYSISVTNLGEDPAEDVQLTDALGSAVGYVSDDRDECSEAGNTVSCAFGTLAYGGTETVIITVQALSAGSTSNTAMVQSSTADPNAGNNSATANVTIDPVADLSITKTGPDTSPRNGEEFEYSIEVTNGGEDEATNVVVTDKLPTAVALVEATGCTLGADGRTVTCDLGTILAGGSEDVTIKVGARSSGEVSNTAEVSSSTHDPDPGDNTATDTTQVLPSANLSITKTGPADAETGESHTYTLNVSNAGPDAAAAAKAVDTLPAGVVFNPASQPGTGCTNVAGTVTCEFGDIPSGGSASTTFGVRFDSAGSKVNNATASSSTHDPVSGNDSATFATQVTAPPPPPSAGLAVQLSDSADPVTVGDTYIYTAKILNGGPDTAENISLTNTLPAGVGFGSAAPAPPNGRGSCSFNTSTRVVSCASLGSLAAGATFDVRIEVQANTAGTKTNSASVSSSTGDPNAADNTDSESTFVQAPPPQPEQTPQQQAAPPPPPPGQSQGGEPIDSCPTAARQAAGFPSDGLLAFVPAAIQLEQQRRRRRLSLVDDKPSAQKHSKRSRKTKVIKIVAVIAVLAVAAVVGVLMLTGGDKGKNYATLGGIEGRVDLQKPEKAFEPATKAATLDIGDKVRTGDDGLARIDYTDGSLTRLDHNTTFQVQELVNDSTHKSIKTNLDVGRVWHRVEKLTKQEDRFEVKTVTAVATVHGTTFVNDCRFNGGRECSHIGIEGTFGIETELGDEGEVSAGQCKTEEGQDIGECRFTKEELENDPFLIQSAKLDGLEKGDAIVLPEIFGEDKKVALVPVDDEPQVQGSQEASTTSPAEETNCPTGQPASRGTPLPLSAGIALMIIFFGVAWARPNRKSGHIGDSAN